MVRVLFVALVLSLNGSTVLEGMRVKAKAKLDGKVEAQVAPQREAEASTTPEEGDVDIEPDVGFLEAGEPSHLVSGEAMERSHEQFQTVRQKDVMDLQWHLGEAYDAECTGYILEVLDKPQEHSWWTSTLSKDPLIENLMERKKSEDLQKNWNKMSDEKLVVAPGLKKPRTNWFYWGLRQTFGRMQKWWKMWSAKRMKSSWVPWSWSSEVDRFKALMDAIRRGKVLENGVEANICMIDTPTLKLLPYSRAWHRDLMHEDMDRHRNGTEKCNPLKAPDIRERRKLGYMDVDRVILATQLAIFQKCHFKCVQFVMANFQKALMRGSTGQETKFCDLTYEAQKSKLSTAEMSEFLDQMINDRESDKYIECEMIFASFDTIAEMADFVIETLCWPFARPTPLYTQSESPPLQLYQEREAYNQPVCRAAGLHADKGHAVQVFPRERNGSLDEPARYCSEGTHCLCQRASRIDHVTAPEKNKKSKFFHIDHWFSTDHCSSLRPSGRAGILWFEPSRMVRTAWARRQHSFQVGNHGVKIGVTLMISGMVMYAASAGWFATAGLWMTETAIPALTQTIIPGIGTALEGGGLAVGSWATAGVGPAIIIGLLGLGMVVRHQTFDCSAKAGCYPLVCDYDTVTKNCHMSLKNTYADEGEQSTLWWMPPAAMKCSLKSRSWGWYTSRSCQLKACKPEEMAKNYIGYYLSPHSKTKTKFDIMNCQPLSLKDMSSWQRMEFLKTLNDELTVQINGKVRDNSRIRKQLVRLGVPGLTLPDCFTDGDCRVGLTGDPFELPYCNQDKVCVEPTLQALELTIEGASEAWQDQLKEFLALELFGSTSDAQYLAIIDEPIDSDHVDGIQAPHHAGEETVVVEGEEAEDELEEGGDSSTTIAPASLLEQGSAVNTSTTIGLGGGPNFSTTMGVGPNFSTTMGMPAGLLEQGSVVQAGGTSSNGSSKRGVSSMAKKVKLVFAPRRSTGLSQEHIAEAIKKLRLKAQHDAGGRMTSAELGQTKRFGASYAVTVTDVGTVCEARSLPEHGVSACGSTKSGYGCHLTCDDGWIGRTNIMCLDDGTWSDTKYEQGVEPEDEHTIFFKCEQAFCPVKTIPDDFCPRGVHGCFTWDSKCDRGGSSGDDRFCDVTPTEGYYLVRPLNNKWQCKTNKQWAVLPEFAGEEPAIQEWTCQGADATAAGLVDDDTVESICTSEVSGKKTEDAEPGLCDILCKVGMEPMTDDPLRCSKDGRWKGMARCQAVTCDPKELAPGVHFDPARVTLTCGTLTPGQKAKDHCQITCVDGTPPTKLDLYCNHEGDWKGEVACDPSQRGQIASQYQVGDSFAEHSAHLGSVLGVALSTGVLGFL